MKIGSKRKHSRFFDSKNSRRALRFRVAGYAESLISSSSFLGALSPSLRRKDMKYHARNMKLRDMTPHRNH